MIRVEHLSKWYGATRAVNDLNFSIESGEVVGFLGPNGAGKSTTMRILAGAIGPSKGRALIGGIDVSERPRDTKRLVGYLPEFPPLYTHMRVRPYLRFCARIKGAPAPKADADHVIERVGLADVGHRLIGHLSKGYRQRVGLAQALVHRPRVLILDEPASGLDPKQMVEIRQLVRDLGQGDTTVLLSTHVLSEVERVCDRVLVISNGELAGADTLDGVQSSTRRVRVRVARPDDQLAQRLVEIEGVNDLRVVDDGRYELVTSADVREQVASLCVPAGLLELTSANSLEDAYLRMTASEDGP
jgi:ABC-2 type transport system ATP-binding protein